MAILTVALCRVQRTPENLPNDFGNIPEKKMGGRGSGRQAGYGFTVDKAEDYRQIDLAWLKRQSDFRVGYRGTIKRSRGGVEVASISYTVEVSGLRLHYRSRSPGSDWIDVNELIQFACTSANYGGQRTWFKCSSCGKRCRILYGGTYFRCRRCYGLHYESQYEPHYCRAASQAHELRARLGQNGSLDEPFPARPKGMHWKTYRRLEARDTELLGRWAAGAMASLRIFGRRTD